MIKSRVGMFLVVASFLVLCGCNSAKARKTSSESNGMSAKYEDEMKKGRTTREQDQRYISATTKVFFELDRSIRGTKKAEATRAAALSVIEANQPATASVVPAPVAP